VETAVAAQNPMVGGGQDVEGVMWRCLGRGGGALHAKEGNGEKGAQ
jgi:hypothetical protein